VEQASSDATACGFWRITTSRGMVTRHSVARDGWHRLTQLTGAPLTKNQQEAASSEVASGLGGSTIKGHRRVLR
jgi:hypothetical protein